MGADDGATLPRSAAGAERFFTARYGLHVLGACGHFVQREQPGAVVDAFRAAVRAKG